MSLEYRADGLRATGDVIAQTLRRVEEEQVESGKAITATVKRVWASRYIRIPVSPREFVTASRYLNLSSDSSPTLISAVSELETVYRGEYSDVLLAADDTAINTDFAAMAMAYDIYVLSCMRDPALTYGLRTRSNITFLVVSSTLRSARTGTYFALSDMVRRSWYFNHVFPFSRRDRTGLHFPNNLHCYPVAARERAVLGVGPYSAVIEEPELMDTTASAKRATPGNAQLVYDKLRMRMCSRFALNGRVPGRIYVASSEPRRRGGFTERLLEQARREATGKRSIYVLSSAAAATAPNRV